jgi:antitoxin (DNA-binding transcriptional repressor) of toxin-antitoxin stability system
MLFSVHEAKTQLSRLIEAALAGEEVVIARGKTPVVRLVPLPRSGFRFGSLAHLLPSGAPDFLEPMDEEELALWEGRGNEEDEGQESGRP